jgi:hypothetical protein
MPIEGSWQKPLTLRDTSQGYSLSPEDEDLLTAAPAVYVFGRNYAETATPLYIGQTLDFRRRILREHFDSIRFMNALKAFPHGERFLLWCTFSSQWRIRRILDVLERGLIDKALTEGHQLINIRGVRTPTHEFKFTGNRISEQIAGRRMLVRKRWFGF